MKRFLVIFFLLLFVLSGFSIGYGAELEAQGTALRKLQRGFLNIALSPFEIGRELEKEKEVDSFIPSWFSGLGRGSAFAAGRALAGVYDLATFPIPYPCGYEPLVYPEFAWEHFKETKTVAGKN